VQRVGHGRPNLSSTLQVDLEQGGHARRKPLLDGGPGGAVAVPRELGPFEELPGGDEPGELGVVDEVVLDAFGLTGPGWARGHRYRQPYLWMGLPDLGDDCALADA